VKDHLLMVVALVVSAVVVILLPFLAVPAMVVTPAVGFLIYYHRGVKPGVVAAFVAFLVVCTITAGTLVTASRDEGGSEDMRGPEVTEEQPVP